MSSQMIARQKLYAEIAELEAELEGWRQVADEVPLLPKYKALVEAAMNYLRTGGLADREKLRSVALLPKEKAS